MLHAAIQAIHSIVCLLPVTANYAANYENYIHPQQGGMFAADKECKNVLQDLL